MEAQADIDRRAIKRRPSNYHSRLTSHPHQPSVSRRSALGKRLRDLADAFAERFGGWDALSVPVAADVRRAAELVALSEQARADALRNGLADPSQLIKLEGIADRAVRRLGLDAVVTRPRLRLRQGTHSPVSFRERLLEAEDGEAG
jgi:hypothetical protein